MKRSYFGFVVALFTVVGVQRAHAQDPSLPGSHAVTVAEYGSYSTSIALGDIPTIEVLAQVHYPTDIANGPYPLVVFLHGRHWSCYVTATSGGASAWPCNAATQAPVPSYQGYDHMASALASHGVIVASISANGINAQDNQLSQSWGMLERGLLVQHHLGMWRTFSTTGATPFGSLFVGKVDLSRVGLMGHSRGGEGVVQAYELNAASSNPFGIRAVLPLAPTNFLVGHDVNRVPTAVILPYCDGDLDELPGASYFDDARYPSVPDETPKYTFLALGANHNYFNKKWTPDQYPHATSDDFDEQDAYCTATLPGNGRLSSAAQRAFGLAYVSAFFRKHLLGTSAFDSILQGDAPPPASAQTNVYEAYHPAFSNRLDINRLAFPAALTTNELAGPVAQTGLAEYQLCGSGTSLLCAPGGRIPHEFLAALRMGWTGSTAQYTNTIPLARGDISNWGKLQFRVALNHIDPKNPIGASRNFSVVLIDAANGSTSVPLSAYSDVLFYPPANGENRASVMNTARIPLSAFTNVDRTSVSAIRFAFNQSGSGVVIVSDIALADEGMTIAETWLSSRTL